MRDDTAHHLLKDVQAVVVILVSYFPTEEDAKHCFQSKPILKVIYSSICYAHKAEFHLEKIKRLLRRQIHIGEKLQLGCAGPH